jgi:hypothetical protein
MAFLVRLRIFHDQPARGPLASRGRSAVYHVRRYVSFVNGFSRVENLDAYAGNKTVTKLAGVRRWRP